MSHLHLRNVHSCGHTAHCEHTEEEIPQFQCKSNYPAEFLQTLGQNMHSDGLWLILGIQVAGIQLLHHLHPTHHHTPCATGQKTISQLYLYWLQRH